MQTSEKSTAFNPNITEEEYRASSRVSNSDLGLLKYSPLYYKQVKDKEAEGISSSGFHLGSLLDCRVLTPHLFPERYVMVPPSVQVPSNSASSYQQTFCDLLIGGCDPVVAYAQAGYSTKGRYEEKALEMAAQFSPYVQFMQRTREEGKAIYSLDDLEKCARMEASLRAHKAANRLLFQTPEEGAAYNQLILFFEWLGVECRSMIDRLVIDDRERIIYLVDLKTTGKPLTFFPYFYEKYDYHRQQAFYEEAVRQWLHGTERDHYVLLPVIVVVDTERVHEVKVLRPDNDLLGRGYDDAQDLLERYRWHRDNGLWEHSREYYLGDGIELLGEEAESETHDVAVDEEV